MGVNVILNGQMYHFDDDTTLTDVLDQSADSVTSSGKLNDVLYDDELG